MPRPASLGTSVATRPLAGAGAGASVSAPAPAAACAGALPASPAVPSAIAATSITPTHAADLGLTGDKGGAPAGVVMPRGRLIRTAIRPLRRQDRSNVFRTVSTRQPVTPAPERASR